MTEFILRKWKPDDAAQLAKTANNPKIAKNLRNTFPHPYTLDDARQFLNICISGENDNQLALAIEVDGKAVGGIGIFVKDDVYEKSAELGYWLSEDYWRQGITSRAVEMICREAFARFDIVRIFAEPFEQNAGSRASSKRPALPTKERCAMVFIKMGRSTPTACIRFYERSLRHNGRKS